MVSVFLAAWLILSGCGRSIEPPAPVLIRIAGSTSMHHLLDILTTAYTTQHAQVTFDIQTAGSDLGIEMLKARQADLAVSSWAPDKEDLARTAGGLRAIAVAQDGISIIVDPTNPVENVTIDQLRGIFRGRIADWREVGGKVGDILVVSREDGSGDRRGFESLVMDRESVTLTAVVMPSSQDVVSYVSTHPNAVGYTSMGELGPEVKALAVEGIEPLPQTVQSGAYPLTRLMTLIAPLQPDEGVKSFLDFAVSPAAQNLIKGLYAPVR